MARLNFSVSERNRRSQPTEAETERALEAAKRQPETVLGRASEALLYLYQTDRAEWGARAKRLLGLAFKLAFEAGFIPPPIEVWRLAHAWTLVQSNPHFKNEDRLRIDRFLLEAGKRAAAEWKAAFPLTQEACAQAMALTFIGDHLLRLYGENPFAALEGPIGRMFDASDPGVREPAVLDIWMSYLLRTERYERLDEAPLEEMTRSVLADADNQKRMRGGPEAAAHARHLLSKIAAFQDDGGPLWIRRWLEREEDGGGAAAGWLTGAYMPDRLPQEPTDIPRLSPTPAAGRGKAARIAFRTGLSPNSEYLRVGAALERIAWRGGAAARADSWTDEPGGGRLSQLADMNGFGYAELAFDSWIRRVFWRFDRYFLTADEWTGEPRVRALTRDWSAEESDGGFERNGQEWTLPSGAGRLRVCAADGQTPDAWSPNDPVHAALLTMEADAQAAPIGPNGFRVSVGGSQEICAFGAFESENGGGRLNAAAHTRTESGMWCVGFRELRANGESILLAEKPIDFRVEWESGEGTLYADEPTTLQWEGESMRIDSGEYTAGFREFDWSAFRV